MAALEPAVQQQPTAKAEMTLERKKDKSGQPAWNHGLFSGCLSKFFCLAFWCPCITYGKNRSRLLHIKEHQTPHPTGGNPYGGGSETNHCVFFCIGGEAVEWINRFDARQYFGIAGTSFQDGLATLCCTPCAQNQLHLELLDEEERLWHQAESNASGAEGAKADPNAIPVLPPLAAHEEIKA